MRTFEVMLIVWGSPGATPRLLGRSTDPSFVEAVRAHLDAQCEEQLRRLRAPDEPMLLAPSPAGRFPKTPGSSPDRQRKVPMR